MDGQTQGRVERELLSIEEAEQALGISRSMIYRLIRAGELVSVTIGSRRLVPVSAIRSYVERLASAAA